MRIVFLLTVFCFYNMQSQIFRKKPKKPTISKNIIVKPININEDVVSIYFDGRIIKELVHNDISVTSSLREVQRNDGKYYTFDISISNNSDATFTQFSKGINAVLYAKNGNSRKVEALTRKEYLKIKKRRQNFRAGVMAFSAGLNAASAGYSASTTNSSANASANYYDSQGYGYANAYGSSTSTTQSYNGAASYSASQNEQAKLSAFMNASEASKRRWNNEYFKIHTMFPQQTISGIINIKYYKAKKIVLKVPVNGVIYSFDWSADESEY